VHVTASETALYTLTGLNKFVSPAAAIAFVLRVAPEAGGDGDVT